MFDWFRRWLRRHAGYSAFMRAYNAAQLADLEYARAHPGCTLAEAHRERERALKEYHR